MNAPHRILLALCLLSAGGLAAAAQAVPSSPASGSAGAHPSTVAGGASLENLSPEEKWIFEPYPGRRDVFYDLEDEMKAQQKLDLLQKSPVGISMPPPPAADAKAVATIKWGDEQIHLVIEDIAQHKWDDAINMCDISTKILDRFHDLQQIRNQIEVLKRYRFQAEEAKIHEEAEAKFDALGLRVEGILWSPGGSLALISGEPVPHQVNERVKDCVILGIDTNKVNFLFHYRRRRFEFQRYIGEQGKSKTGAETAR